MITDSTYPMLPTESPSKPLGIVVLTAWIVLTAFVYLAFAAYIVVPVLMGTAEVGVVSAETLLLVPAAVVLLYSGYGLWQERSWGFVLAGLVFATPPCTRSGLSRTSGPSSWPSSWPISPSSGRVRRLTTASGRLHNSIAPIEMGVATPDKVPNLPSRSSFFDRH